MIEEICQNCTHHEANESYCRLKKECRNGKGSCDEWEKNRFK